MLRLAIIADDLTGALDTGIKFSKKGIGTQIITDYRFNPSEIDSSKEILVIDTETRHLGVNDAYARVYRVIKVCKDIGITYFYKKTDSALRGHIGSELAALYDVIGKPISFVPALPSENRTTKGGIHYIDSLPVAKSIFSKDPLNPVRNSEIGKLIHEETRLTVSNDTQLGTMPDPPGQIVVYDASSCKDMETIAENLKGTGRLEISAGCSGFAEILAEVLPFHRQEESSPPQTRKMIVLCGSINNVARKQVLYASANGFVRVCLSQEEKLKEGFLSTDKGQMFLNNLREICAKHSSVIIDVFSEKTVEDAKEYAKDQGIDPDEIPERISARLGDIGMRLISFFKEESFPPTLMVIGGDTLYSLIRKLEKPVLTPVCELFSGTVSMNTKTENDYFPLISKSGGFGQEDLIINIKKLILKEEVM